MADEKQIARRLKDHLATIDARVDLFAEELDSFLLRGARQILRRIDTNAVQSDEAAGLLGTLISSLRANGLDQQLGRLVDLYEDELSFLENEFFEDTELDRQTQAAIRSVITFDADVIQARTEQFLHSFKAEVMRLKAAGVQFDIDAVYETMHTSWKNQIRTELRTRLSAFNRQIAISRANQSGIVGFLYSGPLDEKTRDFCEERTGFWFHRNQLLNMDNGQGIPVIPFLGGFNCRHVLVPIRPADAVRAGIKQGPKSLENG